MPKQKRFKTDYPGVFYIEGTRSTTGKREKIYYISFRKDGKKVEEKCGRQFKHAMTAAKANRIRSQKIEGILPTNKERREAIEAQKKAEADKWTIDRLFEKYKEGRTKNKALATDTGRYEKYLKPAFGSKEPREIIALDVDRMRINLLKKLSPQTVKHILNLLTWIINFGVKSGLCPGLGFHMQKPTVHNEKTEDLTQDQLAKLLEAIENDTHEFAGTMMKLALFTGIRRGEMFKLKWKHVNFERGFILLKDPKGGPDQTIPLNDSARELLENHKKTKSPFVFPGRGGKQLTNISKAVNEIKEAAGLPKDFRPLHGLRHVYASMLASSGKVDMYVLQKLLTHKNPQTTQRYAHLREEALRNASNLAGDLLKEVTKEKDKSEVVELIN